METLSNLVVVNRIQSGSVFAIDQYTGEDVFIPSALNVTAAIGDGVQPLVCVRQTGETTQWRAIKLPGDDTVSLTATKPNAPESDRAVETRRIVAANGICSMAFVAEELGVDQNVAGYELKKLHTAGIIARASIRKEEGTARASLVLWAISVDSFGGLAA